MYPLIGFIEHLHEHLTGNKNIHGNIVRKHSKKLDDLGDISFPLDMKKWCKIIHISRRDQGQSSTIFDHLQPHQELKTQLEMLLRASQCWALTIDHYSIKGGDVHLYLQRPRAIEACIKKILEENATYGLNLKCFENRINLVGDTLETDLMKITLTELRMVTICNVTMNILNHLSNNLAEDECTIRLTVNSNKKQDNVLICGSVLNGIGVKNTETTGDVLIKKRSLDMQLMAQHKYGIQLKPSWRDYFEKLGKASVIIELLQNRIHKPIRLTLHNLQTTNKCPSFIFYNCARMSALLKQFDDQVSSGVYPELPPIDSIDFGQLSQHEEWEMVYVYLLQFPQIVISSVCDIQSGIVNLHYLVSLLSNLSSVFSVYYRRVKILTNAKDHLLPVLYARIYLIKAVQQVFHTALGLLDIEPVKEM